MMVDNNNRIHIIILANFDCILFEIMPNNILQQYNNNNNNTNNVDNNNSFNYYNDYIPGFIMHSQHQRDMLPSLEDKINIDSSEISIYLNSCNDDKVIQVNLVIAGSTSTNEELTLQGYLVKVSANLMIESKKLVVEEISSSIKMIKIMMMR